MVEMMEANNALQHASSNSLILFDEIGRGTATYDGMALAQAIIEYVHNNIHAKTLFSTHYHELTSLEGQLTRLHNVHVGASEENGHLVFLHKVASGPADKSYGVHVAKLAGMPDALLKRADEILSRLESQHDQDQAVALNRSTQADSKQEAENIHSESVNNPAPADKLMEKNGQMELFATAPADKTSKKDQRIIGQLRDLDLMSMTPMDVMKQVYDWQRKLK